MKLNLIDSPTLKRVAIFALIIVSVLIFGWSLMVWMPGESYQQSLPPLSAKEIELQIQLKRDVNTLASKIGRRNIDNYQNLVAAKEFLDRQLTHAGYTVREQKYTVDGKTFSNLDSRELLRNTIRSFRAQAKFPAEGAALPSAIQGVGWSDHWSFWQQGYQAVMITDTAPFRYPHYHTWADTPEKIDFEKLARVTSGIGKVIRDFVGLAAA